MLNYKEVMIECCKKWQKTYPNTYKNICKHYLKLTKEKNKRCMVCSNLFQTNQYQKKYCSKECKQKNRNARHDAKKKKKGFEILFSNFFPKDIDVDFHHIHPNLPFVIPLPKKIHQRYNSKNFRQHFLSVNKWIEFYYSININIFLNTNT